MIELDLPSQANSRPVPSQPSPLEQLRLYEFGDNRELAIRAVLITLGALTLSYHTGTYEGVLWLAAYGSSQVFAFATLATAPTQPSRSRLITGFAAYMVTTLLFVTLPLWLLAFGTPGMAFCGGVALISGAIFTLWRDDAPKILLPFDIAMGWVISAVMLAVFLPMMQTVSGIALAVVLTVALASYYTMALTSTRQAKAQLRDAALRSLEAQKMESLGRLSGGIAHDFNNILTVLQGSLELYDEVQDTEERRKLVSEAHASAVRASALVRQLLSFARRAPMQLQTIEVDEVLGAIQAMADRLLPASIEVSVAAPAVRLQVETDQDSLVSALLNLVINARDAIENRGKIRLAAQVIEPHAAVIAAMNLAPGRYVAFTIRDNGPGMPPETLAKAVEPFFTTKPAGAGSGLGLPSAKGFAEQSGGGLGLQSEPGDTRVTLYLPLSAAGG